MLRSALAHSRRGGPSSALQNCISFQSARVPVRSLVAAATDSADFLQQG